MRSLHADLTAAQKAASREPVATVTVRNELGIVRRLEYDVRDTTAYTNAKHDVAVTADGAVQRVRMDAGTVKHQRVTAPTGPWGTWTNLAAGMGSNIACAAYGQRVIVIYSDAGGLNVRYRESTDSGQTFSADALLFASPFAIADLAVTYRNTGGDLAVAWVTSGTVRAYINERTAGVFAGAVAWPHSAAALNGIAIVRGLYWEMVLTGDEVTTTKPTVWSLNYSAPNWSTLWVQVQGEAGITAFGAPSLTFTDTWRVNYTEAQLFTGGATRLYRTWVHPDAGFDAGAYTWRTPYPVAYANTYGVALAADQTFTDAWLWESGVDLVQRADTTTVTLDVSADVLTLDLRERLGAFDGYLDLDNSGGAYADPAIPLQLGNRVTIALGYVTASGARTSTLADLFIAGWEHRRAGGASIFRLELESGWDLLRRSTQRTAISHITDTYFTIAARICARAGLDLQNASGSGRFSSVTPAFTIAPGTSGYTALHQLLAFLRDQMFMAPGCGLRNIAPGATETTDYTFGTDHPLHTIELRTPPYPVSEAHALGAATFGDDLDYGQLAAGVGRIETIRDLTSATALAADTTAADVRRGRQFDAHHGRLTAPPCLGLELLDVVDCSDALIGASAILRRVRAIRWRLDRPRGVYLQEIGLGPR